MTFVIYIKPPSKKIIFTKFHRSNTHMTKNQIISYLRKNKDILSIRAISEKSGFKNLHKVLNEQKDAKGFLFTFPDKHVAKVLKEIKRLQTAHIKR